MTARLALFDCDGTIADSQHAIVDAMGRAFDELGLPPPPAHQIRATIGLSLPHIARMLVPDASAALHAALVDAYRTAYFTARTAAGAAPEPLYDGIITAFDSLLAEGWLLGIATGKSRRGLDRLLAAHGLTGRFVTVQTADTHPSKPDPAMVIAAASETGIAAADIVVIGDTDYDMIMAKRAGAAAVGVSWGYHDATALSAAGARAVARDPADLVDILEKF